ncbi:Uncharacterised nucleotidyltransferase [Pseudomonas asturiensis]|uniref:Uncharacterized nucleotidyltransferase n=2 Tax=Pseudomonas asturiensis TaxID=1190415 RepID=A0A1M7JUB8_9PSED|nr:Uncharacterised nucleotidyltransferase [Pseudomonas asturiensis]
MLIRHSHPAASDAGDAAVAQPKSGDDLLQFTLWLMGFGPSDMPNTPPSASASASAFVRHHGIAGLLVSTRIDALDLPNSIALNNEQRRIALRSLQLGGTLKTLVAAFAARDLKPLALKGPVLALQAHGSLGARGGVDLDLMLDELKWPQALEVLHDLGYTLAPDQHLPLPAGTHELVLLHRTRPRVELHRRLLRQRHLLQHTDAMACDIDLQGTPVASLKPMHALAYLIAHANQHCFRRLIWLIDIHALLQRPDFDAAEAARQIKLSGTRAMLDACLTLLERFFGTQVASPLQQMRRPCRASKAMVDLATVAICNSLSDNEVAARLGPLKRVMLDVALQDTPKGRWNALAGWLSPTGKDSNWVILPRLLAFLYPAVRLYRLVMRSR